MRAYRDLGCRAMRCAIVVVAVFNVTLDALNVLAAHAAASLILFHHSVSFLSSDKSGLGKTLLSRLYFIPFLPRYTPKRRLSRVTFCHG